MFVLVAPAMRADEYNKLTYLTFSGPVQVPGAVLPAGTYMLKLADPDSGRRVIQIWDQEGKKLFTTLLSIPDQMIEAQDEPVVLFTERPSGEPQAIKAWFYPSDRYGYEFVYPKDQAIKIAQATNASVLAQNETPKDDADVATRAGATVGRVNQSGQFEETRSARAEESAQPAPAPAQTPRPAPDPQASTPAAADQTPAPAAATQPSANRTGAASPAPARRPGASASAARSTDEGAATGTSTSRREAVGTSGELPNTASWLPVIQLLAALSLAGAVGARQLRQFNRR
jgi:hypothetical protein